MGKLRIDGVRQVEKNGRVALEEYSYEKDFPGEPRHSRFCEYCGNERYPACTADCISDAAKAYREAHKAS